jgi:lysophospholipase L1-like esterase
VGGHPLRVGQERAEHREVVTVLIGTNDLRFALSDKDAASLRRRWKLTEDPTAAGYRDNLSAIVARLRERTRARVALLSPPVIGEDLESLPVRKAGEYSRIVCEVAAEHDVTYLPLNERMVDLLRAAGRTPGTAFRPGVLLAATAATQHFVLRRGLDAISRSRGLRLTTDTIHLNDQGAVMIADLVEGFVRNESTIPGTGR